MSQTGCGQFTLSKAKVKCKLIRHKSKLSLEERRKVRRREVSEREGESGPSLSALHLAREAGLIANAVQTVKVNKAVRRRDMSKPSRSALQDMRDHFHFQCV